MITGASRGIGKATALEFGKSGNNNFYLCCKSDVADMFDTKDKLLLLNNDVIIRKLDVTDRPNIRREFAMLGIIHPEFKVDVLINNAGILRDRTLKNMTDEEWDEVIAVNLTGVYNITKTVLPFMNKGGCIVNITSMSGLTGNFGQCNYASAKAGVIGFTKSLAKELGRDKIRVNVVVVGLCDTDMSRSIPKIAVDSFVERMPLKRMSTSEEVAKIVKFICDGDSYCTGSVFDVSGGLI